MIMHKYTAKLFFNNQTLAIKDSNDLVKLTVILLNWVEDSTGCVHGIILNNLQGDVIQRCRRTMID